MLLLHAPLAPVARRLLLPARLEWQWCLEVPFAFATEASLDPAADEALMNARTACRFRRVFLAFETPDAHSQAGAGTLKIDFSFILDLSSSEAPPSHSP